MTTAVSLLARVLGYYMMLLSHVRAMQCPSVAIRLLLTLSRTITRFMFHGGDEGMLSPCHDNLWSVITRSQSARVSGWGYSVSSFESPWHPWIQPFLCLGC